MSEDYEILHFVQNDLVKTVIEFVDEYNPLEQGDPKADMLARWIPPYGGMTGREWQVGLDDPPYFSKLPLVSKRGGARSAGVSVHIVHPHPP